MCWLLFASLWYSEASQNNNITIGINLINTYSGTLEWSEENNFVVSDELFWTNSPSPILRISASTGWYFQILNEYNTVLYSGSYDEAYTHTYSPLLTTDGIYHYKAIFHSNNGEPLFTDILSVIFDKTPPSLPIIYWPNNHELITGDTIELSRWTSTDIRIWLDWYRIHFSLVPDFSSDITITTNNNFLILSGNELPHGTIFWYIEPIDKLGNSNAYGIVHFFHNQKRSIIDRWSIRFSYIRPPLYEEWPWVPSTSWSIEWIIPENEEKPDTDNVEWSQPWEAIIPQPSPNWLSWASDNNNNSTISLKDQLLSFYYNTYKKICQQYGQCLILPSENNWIHDSAPQEHHYETLIQSYQWFYPIGLGINIISYIFSLLYVILWHSKKYRK